MEQEVDATDPEVKLSATAHHEAGHLVVAAVVGLPLRPEGLCIDPAGEGLACYWKQPEETDLSRESVILASFAGWYAHKRFCELRSLDCPELAYLKQTSDWREAREVMCKFSDEYLEAKCLGDVQLKLENSTALQVETHWHAIGVLAAGLMAKDWEPLKPLKSGDQWSDRASAKYMAGEEAVVVLRECGISACCVATR